LSYTSQDNDKILFNHIGSKVELNHQSSYFDNLTHSFMFKMQIIMKMQINHCRFL
jgi:hypothetical protein